MWRRQLTPSLTPTQRVTRQVVAATVQHAISRKQREEGRSGSLRRERETWPTLGEAGSGAQEEAKKAGQGRVGGTRARDRARGEEDRPTPQRNPT